MSLVSSPRRFFASSLRRRYRKSIRMITAHTDAVGNALRPDDQQRKLRTICETARDIWQ